MFFLTGKVVAITGASSGLGKALTERMIAEGANVALCARNVHKLRELFPDSQRVLCFQADVSNEQDCSAFIAATINKWQRLDVLINNAGISMRALFEDLDLDVLRNVMGINFWGTVYCSKFALPHLLQSKGVLVGISSIAGYRGLPCRTGYSASKFAMQGFLESLRSELLLTGVHVMWASPGFVATNIRNVALGADGAAQKETPLNESKLMSAETCASIIVAGIMKKKRTLIMTPLGKLTVWLNKLFPALADRMALNHFLKEPDAPVKKYLKSN